MKVIKFLYLVLLTGFVFNCTKTEEKVQDNATSGEVKIAVDESFKSIIESELAVFHALYTRAHITPIYTSERKAIQLMLQDSVSLAIVSRKLDSTEYNYLAKYTKKGRTTDFALDAVAFIVSKSNKDSIYTYESIKNLLQTGKSKNDISIVFDNNNSGNLFFLKNKLGIDSFPKNTFAQNSTQEVIDYVKSHNNAIGVIGAGWISDWDDPKVRNTLAQVALCGFKDSIGVSYPFQEDLATGRYPFRRNIYMITSETYLGLGTGFASFAAGDKGQRIVLKAGLLPYTSPGREIKIKIRSGLQ